MEISDFFAIYSFLRYNRVSNEVTKMSIKDKDKISHLMVMFPADLLGEIESYKNENNIRSSNQTIRTLIKKGLESED